MNVKTETKKSCWLCEEGKRKKLYPHAYGESIYVGKNNNGELAFYNDSFGDKENIYKPKFCPECGRDLTKEEKKMEHKIITYGICDDTTYVIEAIDDYYSLWFVDEIPVSITAKGIEDFIEENCLKGCSVTGDFKFVMKELEKLITDLT